MLSIFREANAKEIVLEEDDEGKLKYLTSAKTTSRTIGKSTYVTWLRFFDEGDGIML